MKTGPTAGTSGRFPHLVVVEGYGMGRIFSLVEETTIIGRDPGGGIVLPYSTVSWHHASIATNRDNIVLRDLGSRNGTFVGVDRIVRRELADGDLIAIGDSIVLKLTFLSTPDNHATAAVNVLAQESTGPVANVATLLNRLRTERSFTQYEDASLVLIFLRIEDAPPEREGRTATIEESMRRTVAVVREGLGATDLLARASDRELILLLRSTIKMAERTAEKIRLATAKQLKETSPPGASTTATAALVPVSAGAALSPEAILVAASRKAQRAMDGAPNGLLTISLDDADGR